MKLELKFKLPNILSFVVICALFYWFCPLPSAAFWRIFVSAVIILFAFGVSFVVVTHQGFIRHTPQPSKKRKR